MAPSLNDLIVVCGGGGFIGGHLVADLLRQGHRTSERSTSSRSRSGISGSTDVENLQLDLQETDACESRGAAGRRSSTTSRPTWAGWGSSRTTRRSACCSVLINTHLLHGGARDRASSGSSIASSACVYNADKQTDPQRRRRSRKRMRIPAMPEDGYGWEKLFSERMCRHFREDFGLADARGALPQRLRPARHVRRRAREGAGRDLPQGDRGQAQRASTRSRSGATASRRGASCTSTIASKGTQAILASEHHVSRSTSAAARWSRSISSSTSSRTSPGSS